TWPIEHVAAGGAELLLILNKALGYATRIRDSVPAKPHRIRGTCIYIVLRISTMIVIMKATALNLPIAFRFQLGPKGLLLE
ncbi:MAG: hypothetical protein WCF75_21200, partial [Pseudolabrys sp.]